MGAGSASCSILQRAWRHRGAGMPSRARAQQRPPIEQAAQAPTCLPPSPAHPTPMRRAGERWAGSPGGRGREQRGTPPHPQGSLAGRGDRDRVIIYAPPLMLYGFLNSAPATINVVNAEIISIFWRQAVIYSSHFSGGGSHAVKSSALPIKC